jgi:hypothetical protein
VVFFQYSVLFIRFDSDKTGQKVIKVLNMHFKIHEVSKRNIKLSFYYFFLLASYNKKSLTSNLTIIYLGELLYRPDFWIIMQI